MNDTKLAKTGQIAGIIYIVEAALTFLGFLFSSLIGFSFWSILELAAFAFLAVLFMLKRKDFLIAIGFGVLLILALRGLFVSYGFAYKLVYLFQVIAYAAITLFALTDFIPSLKEPAKKYWYLPAGGMVICIIPVFLLSVINLFRGFGFFNFIVSLITAVISYGLSAAGLYFAAAWMEAPEKMPIGGPSAPRPSSQQPQGTYQSVPGQGPRVTSSDAPYSAPAGGSAAGNSCAPGGNFLPESAYCGLAKHVLLLLFTFGIWYLIWIYRTTENLNCLEDEPPRTPVNKLLLCMFVPFYSIYWVYKSAQRIDRLSAMRGTPSDSATLCLILAIVIGIVPPILMQDKINAIVTAQGNGWTAPQQAQTSYAAPQQPRVNYGGAQPHSGVVDVADELKKYKELLDMGAITQEEFDEKKKQLLNL